MFIIIIVTAIIFFVLVKIFGSENNRQYDRKELTQITFTLPKEIICNDRNEAMPIWEREKRRRKLLNEVYMLGFYARENLRERQFRDRLLSRQPYYYLSNKSKIICQPTADKVE